jgi:hypothetical protein
MKKTTATKQTTKRNLPAGVTEADTKWPEYDSKDKVNYRLADGGALTFYETEDRKGNVSWVIATLYIGGHRTKAPDFTSNRTYGIRLDGAIVTCGAGPHVKQTLTVYLRESRVEKLRHYVDLYNKGLKEALQIRDRIGSRRAQGQVERALGHTSWIWNK